MTEEFTFVNAGRTFVCCVEPLRGRGGEPWWWFRVSSESYGRFAPFRAGAADTPAGVQDRIVAYYDDLLARRAAPATTGWARGRGVTSRSPSDAPAPPTGSGSP